MTLRQDGRKVFGTIKARRWEGLFEQYRVKSDIFYVDPVSGGDGLDGKTWDTALLTLTRALVLAGDWDIICLLGGDYAEHVSITQRGLKLLGLGNSGVNRGSPLFIGSTASCVKIRNHDVEIAYVGFYQTSTFAGLECAVLPETYWRQTIRECGFSSSGTGTYGIHFGDTAAEAPWSVVEDCRFSDWATAGVRANSGAMVTRRNLFEVKANAIGVQDPQNSTSRPNRWILDNLFKALNNSNSQGIEVTNTPTAGYLMIDGNHFINFGSNNLCISKRTGYAGLNYLGITAIPIT